MTAPEEPRAPSAQRRLPSLVLWLGVVSLFTDVGTESVYPLLPLFLADVLHAPRAFIGTVEGAAEATASLLKLVSGRITDRTARRKPLTLVGYGLSSIVRPLVGLATHPWHVLATRVADRVGKGLRASPRDALLADAAPPELRGRAYGFHQAMDNAGAVIGPLASTALLAAGIALRNVFLLSAVPGVLAMCALFFGVREERPEVVPVPKEVAAVDPTTRRALIRYLGAVALFGLGNSSDAFLLLRATQCGVAVKYVPLVWMAHNATKAALSTWAGGLSDRLDRRYVVIGGWSIYAVVYLGFGFATNALQIWALFIAYGGYYAFTEGAGKAMVADLAPPTARGRTFGWYNATVGLVALPASLAFGALSDRFSVRVPFVLSAALAVAAAAWLMLGRLRGVERKA